MRSPFSVYTRASRDRLTGREVRRFVAKFIDPDTGRATRYVTLEATNRRAAIQEAERLLSRGAACADPLVVDLVRGAWEPGSRFLSARECSVGYIVNSRKTFDRFLAEGLAGVRFSQLTPGKVEDVLHAKLRAGASPRGLQYALGALRGVTRDHARRHRLADPLQFVEKPRYVARERGVLGPVEVARIIALGPEDVDPYARLAVLLGCLAGLRMGELRGLRPEDVDRARGLLHIRINYLDDEGAKKPKCGSARDVPAPEPLLDAIDALLALSPVRPAYVLALPGAPEKPYPRHRFVRGVGLVLAAIGIDEEERRARGLVGHAMRHTFVSLSAAAGVSAFAIQAAVGHKSDRMTAHYTHRDARLVDFQGARERLTKTIEEGAAKAAGGRA